MATNHELKKAELIESIYDFALKKVTLNELLSQIKPLIDGDVYRLNGWRSGEPEPCVRGRSSDSIDVSILEHHEHMYFSGLHKADPRVQIARTTPDGKSIRCSDFLDKKFKSKSEFYRELLMPYGNLFWLCGARINLSPEMFIDLAIERVLDKGEFNLKDVDLIGQLVPNFKKAFEIMFAISNATQQSSLTEGVVAGLGKAVFLVDTSLNLISCSGVAEEFIKSKKYFRYENKKIWLAGEDNHISLRKLVKSVHRDGATRYLAINHRNTLEDREFCSVYIFKFDHPSSFGGLLPCNSTPKDSLKIVIVASLSCTKNSIEEKTFMQMFDLTKAQARVAKHLIRGISAAAIAKEIELEECTVRSHIKSILAKTNLSDLNTLRIALCNTVGLFNSSTYSQLPTKLIL